MSESIAQAVRDAGIVGAGGAGFPTHVKVASRADTVIANGAECEPLLRGDKALMRQRPAEVLRGLWLLGQATGARRVVLALKAHYHDVVERVRQVGARELPEIEVHELDNFYPAGDEQVLVHAVTGRVVPEGGIPIQVGVVVNNVVTLSQVARAVGEGAPVTRRLLTVAGAVRRPMSCELPVGAPIRLAVEHAGGAAVPEWRVIEGGPMMGRLVGDLNDPITKKTSGLLVLPLDHPLVVQRSRSLEREVRLARAACCQCRMCTDLCPRANLGHAIRPHLAMRTLTVEGLADPAPEHVTAAFLCSMCGACEAYACVMGLSPRRMFDRLRVALSAAGQRNPHQRADCEAHPFQVARRIPLPRLVARLGLSDYVDVPDEVVWRPPPVAEVRLLLSQHVGAPAVPVVEEGQAVREGDLVGEIPEGAAVSARVHASITGRVSSVTPDAVVIHRS